MTAIDKEYLEATASNLERQQADAQVAVHRFEGARLLVAELLKHLDEEEKPAMTVDELTDTLGRSGLKVVPDGD